jgi:dTDP-4-amino-4,6-dideoxygalactose transaminase
VSADPDIPPVPDGLVEHCGSISRGDIVLDCGAAFGTITWFALARQALIGHLREHGVLAVFHYTPLHTSQMGARVGGRPGDCPVTEWVSDRLVRLPFYNDLAEHEQSEVVDLVRRFRA